MMIEHDPGVRAVEAALFAAEQPMTLEQLRGYVGENIDVAAALKALEEQYQGRGIDKRLVEATRAHGRGLPGRVPWWQERRGTGRAEAPRVWLVSETERTGNCLERCRA